MTVRRTEKGENIGLGLPYYPVWWKTVKPLKTSADRGGLRRKTRVPVETPVSTTASQASPTMSPSPEREGPSNILYK
ncbi:hypothetical protein Zmor_008648 [Zophobas morio]|uniref:Uncharacterized protein n=1 Tax=Zophobas morio TaxID=2755281 RepID=A0AA38HP97_9CUCU|nr:hypothetical protein Zmor_008648 [Zophobas morio]